MKSNLFSVISEQLKLLLLFLFHLALFGQGKVVGNLTDADTNILYTSYRKSNLPTDK